MGTLDTVVGPYAVAHEVSCDKVDASVEFYSPAAGSWLRRNPS
jgi:hypothetical protein